MYPPRTRWKSIEALNYGKRMSITNLNMRIRRVVVAISQFLWRHGGIDEQRRGVRYPVPEPMQGRDPQPEVLCTNSRNRLLFFFSFASLRKDFDLFCIYVMTVPAPGNIYYKNISNALIIICRDFFTTSTSSSRHADKRSVARLIYADIFPFITGAIFYYLYG